MKLRKEASDPAVGAVLIDYSGADQSVVVDSRGIYITTAGTLVVEMAQNGDSATFSGLLAGVVYPFAVRKIVKTSSTAAGYILY